jgi:site-specific recombinase XerD
MFLSEHGSRLSARVVQHLVHKWCLKLSVGRIHVHQLRHSFATRMVNAGMSSAVLRELMGHSSFTTTQRYFRIRPKRLATEFRGGGIHQREVIMVARSAASAVGGELPLTAHACGMMCW